MEQKNITSIDINLSDIPNEGATRGYSILGDDNASFMLQVVNASNQFYNFKTKYFKVSMFDDKVIKMKIIQ